MKFLAIEENDRKGFRNNTSNTPEIKCGKIFVNGVPIDVFQNLEAVIEKF